MDDALYQLPSSYDGTVPWPVRDRMITGMRSVRIVHSIFFFDRLLVIRCMRAGFRGAFRGAEGNAAMDGR